MSLVTMLKGKGKNGFGGSTTAEEVTDGIDLSGKTYLVTGAGSGLGRETTRVLGLRGAHVIAAARTEQTAATALQETGVQGTAVSCDLSEPSSVRDCVKQVTSHCEKIDGIVCNAGIMALPKLEVKHGLEMQFLVNHIGHFILATGLIDRLTENGRVVILSSSAHQMARGGIDFDNLDGQKGYSAWSAYGVSKLANLLFAKQLAKRFEGTTRTANAVHPGVIRTNLARHMNLFMRGAFAAIGPVFLKTIPQGAATQCFVATHPSLTTISGLYFADCRPKKPAPFAEDADAAKRLWDHSEAIVARL